MDVNDVLNTEGVVPSFIDASSLVAKRLHQISDLVDVIRHGGRDRVPKTTIQRLPRHMRRRAMSHNIKRLPRKYHAFAAKSFVNIKHLKKPPSRLQRRRPKNLQLEYAKRSNNSNRWLQTHIWHAKRFEMIKLWNFKIPLRCYQRGVRPFMKQARDGVVMFDDSYYRMLRFRFTSADQLEIFNRNYAKLTNVGYCSLKELRISSSGFQILFTCPSYVILSVHPLFFDKPLELLNALTGLYFKQLETTKLESILKSEYGDNLPITGFEADGYLVTDETNLYSMLTLYGAKAISSLFGRLNLIKNEELQSDNLSQIHNSWEQFNQYGGSVNDLKNGSCFTLLVEDPRLSTVKQLKKIEPSTLTFKHIQPKQSNLLFDRQQLAQSMSGTITEEELNNMKSVRVGTIKLKNYKIPIAISLWNWCSTNHVKVVLPANVTRDFFSYFYRCGFRVGSLSDRFVLCSEISDCSYPFLFLPLMLEKPLYRWRRYHRFKEVKFDQFGKWNNMKNWDYIIDNPVTLSYLQSLIDRSSVSMPDSELFKLKNALIPVRISFKKIKQITDDSLIYEWCEKKSVELMDVDVIEEDYNPDKFFDDSESEPEIEMEKSFRKQHCNTKVHEDDGLIIGRIAFSAESHYRGHVEAFGYVELESFEKLRRSSGKIRVRNPNSPKLVDACLSILYS